VAGAAVTPDGRPETATVTGEEKPLTGLTVTVSERGLPPLCNARDVGAATTAKLGEFVGFEDVTLHPQTISGRIRAKRACFIGGGTPGTGKYW
jgi:hypothetical protein